MKYVSRVKEMCEDMKFKTPQVHIYTYRDRIIPNIGTVETEFQVTDTKGYKIVRRENSIKLGYAVFPDIQPTSKLTKSAKTIMSEVQEKKPKYRLISLVFRVKDLCDALCETRR